MTTSIAAAGRMGRVSLQEALAAEWGRLGGAPNALSAPPTRLAHADNPDDVLYVPFLSKHEPTAAQSRTLAAALDMPAEKVSLIGTPLHFTEHGPALKELVETYGRRVCLPGVGYKTMLAGVFPIPVLLKLLNFDVILAYFENEPEARNTGRFVCGGLRLIHVNEAGRITLTRTPSVENPAPHRPLPVKRPRIRRTPFIA
jgi:hypothetical protein